MKILDIRLKNLNSLRGTWHINLSENIYITDGIFAITGPTGAGKTTIFDAICLALYGQTPRLGKVSGKNEIMSKHTRECYAEVIFSAQGRKYKCSWRQYKASNGKLQTAKHMMSELDSSDSGKIITDNSKDVQTAVDNITGMDFKRFTQAVMLEQGGFDAFLKAKEGDRSQVLERLTGTKIYGEISNKVYVRTSEERLKLDKLQAEVDSKKPRDTFGTEEEIAQLLIQKQAEQSALETAHTEMKQAVDWLKNISDLERELGQVNGSIIQLTQSINAFTPQRLRLDAAQRANDLMPGYAALAAGRSQLRTTKTRCDDNERTIASIKEALTQIDSVLPNLKTELERRTHNLTELPEAAYARALQLLNAYTQTAKKRPDFERAKRQAEERVQKAQENFSSAQEEYSKCIAHYEDFVLNKTRNALTPGTPCPVCGSTEHPAITHTKEICDTELTTEDFEKVSRRLQTTQSELSSAIANMQQCTQNLDASLNDSLTAREAVLEVIEPMGIFDTGITNCGEIFSRLDKWISEVRKLTSGITDCEQKQNKFSTQYQTIQTALQKDKAALDSMTAALAQMERDFSAALAEKGFTDERDFTAALMDSGEFAQLQERAKTLDEQMSKLAAVRSDRTARLETEKAKGLTSRTLESLEPEYTQQEAEINALRKTVYEIEHAIHERRQLQEETQELTAKRDSQLEIYNNWAALNKLIGSQNGNNFRIFAQKITLQMMIALANKQLERMSGRYRLTAEPDDDGLELSVIDNEQAGEIRPTKNLSGGERFIVSLALALGLSQISGSRAQVDSLFLDEGFGSLDEETLNTALEALGEVKREGRMIGIISHVAALRERIAAQINVIPKRDGVSIIEGPGCSREG